MGFFDLSAYNIERGDEKSKALVIHNCKACGRFRDCSTPKASYVGNGKKGILVVGPEMTSLEDHSNNEQHGTHYRFIKKAFNKVGIDIEEDCWYTHSIRCHSKAKIGAITSSACHRMLIEEIKLLKPRIIVTTCQEAFDILLYDRMAGRASNTQYIDWCGELIPDQVLKTWIAPVYPTSLIMKEQEERYNKYELYYQEHFRRISRVTTDCPTFDIDSRCHICTNERETREALKEIATWDRFAFDYETTGLKPHRKGHEIVYISASNGEVSYAFKSNGILDLWAEIMTNDAVKIAHNQSFERSWTENICHVAPNKLIHDTMLIQHCLHNRKPTGLKFITYARLGILGYDADSDKYLKPSRDEQNTYGSNGFNRIKEAPPTKMMKYNAMDSLFTYWLYEMLIDKLHIDHQLPGYKFFIQGQIAFDRAHENGMCVDEEVIDKSSKQLTKDISKYETLIMDDPLIRLKWDRGEFNPKSDLDLRHLLFDILGYEVNTYTKQGLPSVDADALLAYKDRCELANHLLKYRKWSKALNTYMAQNTREVVDGKVRGFFSLNAVVTFRSNSRNPNQQNIPKRDKETMKIVRSVYVASPGCRIIEYDFKGAEVSCAAAVTGDKNLIKYVSNPDLDMHRDLATGLFFIPIDKVNKVIRGEYTKGPWTFAQFYGSWYKQCADNIWQMLHTPSSTAKFGFDIVKHLEDNGIESPLDWEEHCKKQEKVLWDDFFPGYQEFRNSTFDNFQKKGYIDFVDGFRYYGPATRNECLNAPVQGPAFHIQLWAFTQITKEIEKKKMKSKLIGSIHDSMVVDVAVEEEAYMDHLVYEYATQKVREHWDWITVPLMVEKERSEVNGDWSKMESCGFLKGGMDAN